MHVSNDTSYKNINVSCFIIRNYVCILWNQCKCVPYPRLEWCLSVNCSARL